VVSVLLHTYIRGIESRMLEPLKSDSESILEKKKGRRLFYARAPRGPNAGGPAAGEDCFYPH
jgi:hypothetical protein